MPEPRAVCRMCQQECDVKESTGDFSNGDRIAQVSVCCSALIAIYDGEEYIENT